MESGAITRLGTHSFTVNRDTTLATGDGSYDKGTHVRYEDGGSGSFEYGVVISAVDSAGTTTVTLATNSDYSCGTSFANLEFNNIMPGTWFTYSATPTGYATTNNVHRFKLDGTTCTLIIREATPGASSATTHFKSLPITAATITNMAWTAYGTAVNNTSSLVRCSALISSASTTVQFFQDVASTWTSSNNTAHNVSPLIYEIA